MLSGQWHQSELLVHAVQSQCVYIQLPLMQVEDMYTERKAFENFPQEN